MKYLQAKIKDQIEALQKFPTQGLPFRYKWRAFWWFVKRRTRMIVEKQLPPEEVRNVQFSAKNIGWYPLYGSLIIVPLMARVQMFTEHPYGMCLYCQIVS